MQTIYDFAVEYYHREHKYNNNAHFLDDHFTFTLGWKSELNESAAFTEYSNMYWFNVKSDSSVMKI